ncbi:MAG TPA: 6-pyruvoyl tetrahydropterin synthase, partial [Microcoleaceae bacterium UBA10368]|nr:6-pyruvoyl tetrahydropterin synthase [Microcoleaceae cyanobacterium UBA10368]
LTESPNNSCEIYCADLESAATENQQLAAILAAV